MMRLVTQFDARRTRATLATPTCCCCCCCIATIVSTTALTVLNVDEIVKGAQVSTPSRWLHAIGAFAALPFAVAAAGAASLAIGHEELGIGLGVGVFFVVWVAALLALHRQAGLRRGARPVGVTVLLGSLLFCVELYVGGSLLIDAESGDGAFLLYLVIALLLPLAIVPLLRRLSGH